VRSSDRPCVGQVKGEDEKAAISRLSRVLMRRLPDFHHARPPVFVSQKSVGR